MKPAPSRRKRPSRMKVGPAFEFVDNSGSSWKNLQKGDARTIIRRQAARSGRQGHLRESGSQHHEYSLTTRPEILRTQPSNNGFETMRVIYNFDITALDSFVDVDHVVHASLLLQDNPGNAAALLHKASSSFLAYLPSRYGSNPFLNDAMHCVAARAAQMLGQSTIPSSPAELHSKALRSLYSAIGNNPSCSVSDVYCATRLLVLYESLGFPNVDALAIHNECGIKLLRQTDPRLDLSRFERMLFRSHGPHILISEIYKQESSMFEATGWQNFFARAASIEKSADARYWWKFFGSMTFLPGILKDVRALFSDTTLHPFEYLSRSFGILERANNMNRALNDSHMLYQRSALKPQSLLDLPRSDHVESTDRVRLQGFLRYTTMFTFRLQATLSPSEVDRAMGEEEAQRLAAQTLLSEKMTSKADPSMAWQLKQRNDLTYSIIRTREELLPINERGDSWNDNVLAEELGRANIED